MACTRTQMVSSPRTGHCWVYGYNGTGGITMGVLQPFLFAEYHRQIDTELDERIKKHRMTMAAAEARREFDDPNRPLILLAGGDSWFDYPLNGNVPLARTDIVSQLQSLPGKAPHVLNFAHFGDSTSSSFGVRQQRRLIRALTEQTDPPFDAILYSTGGDEIAGDRFCLWLNDARRVDFDPGRGINAGAFAAILDVVKKSYMDLIALRDEFLPGQPIFCHDYDFIIPSGKGFCGVGPWLEPALGFRNWNDRADGTEIIWTALLEFKQFLVQMAAGAANIVLVDTQGTLQEDTAWANELHPAPSGFQALAEKFRKALASKFPGRI